MRFLKKINNSEYLITDDEEFFNNGIILKNYNGSVYFNIIGDNIFTIKNLIDLKLSNFILTKEILYAFGFKNFNIRAFNIKLDQKTNYFASYNSIIKLEDEYFLPKVKISDKKYFYGKKISINSINNLYVNIFFF